MGSVTATNTTSSDTSSIENSIPDDSSIQTTQTTSNSQETKSSNTQTTSSSKDSSNSITSSSVSNTNNEVSNTATQKSETSTNSTIDKSNIKVANTTTKSLKTSTESKTKTVVSTDSITTYPKKTVTFKATVKTTGGTNINTGKVAFKINGITIGTTSVNNGQATIKYTIPSSWSKATYTITTVYGETTDYQASTGKATLTLYNVSNTVTKVSEITTYPKKTVTLKATVKTTGGTNINTGKVAFKINGITIGTANVNNGQATIKYTIPSSWSKATYLITAVYGQYGVYKASTGKASLQLYNVSSTVTKVTSISSDAGKTVTFKATVKTTGGTNINTGKVAFKINGITIGTANVNNGQATIKYTIPSSYDGTYKITVVYGQYGVYKASTGTGKLTVTETIPSSLLKYLKETNNCQISDSSIQSLAKYFNKTYSSTLSKAKAIFNYLNDATDYSGYYNTRYGAVKTLSKGYGNCVDMAHLLIAVARASGIPARYCHSVCTFRSGLVTGHVWAELYVNGNWYSCDLTSSSNTFGNIVNWKKCTSIKRYIQLPF